MTVCWLFDGFLKLYIFTSLIYAIFCFYVNFNININNLVFISFSGGPVSVIGYFLISVIQLYDSSSHIPPIKKMSIRFKFICSICMFSLGHLKDFLVATQTAEVKKFFPWPYTLEKLFQNEEKKSPVTRFVSTASSPKNETNSFVFIRVSSQ